MHTQITIYFCNKNLTSNLYSAIFSSSSDGDNDNDNDERRRADPKCIFVLLANGIIDYLGQ